MSKKLQVLADPVVALDPTLVIFFGNEKISISKKITSMGSKHQLNPTLVIFLEMIFFSFPKKLQVLDQVHFKKVYNDWIRPTLLIFLTFFEKNYNNWIKCKLPKSRTKWTDLYSNAIKK
jgi:hypothetical protein